MDKLNILKLVIIFVLLVISQSLVTYLVLGGMNAYYGVPLVYNWVYKLMVSSPIVYFYSIQIIFHIFLAFIVIRLAKKEKENRFIWFIFTAIFGLSAIAILYLKVILDKINKTQTDPEIINPEQKNI